MALSEQVAADLKETVYSLDDFAIEALFTPRDGEEITVRILTGSTIDAFEDRTIGRYSRTNEEIMLPRAADIGFANPGKDDKLTIAGTTWSVVQISRQDADNSVLEIAFVTIDQRRDNDGVLGGATS